jgi:hypothetical protein
MTTASDHANEQSPVERMVRSRLCPFNPWREETGDLILYSTLAKGCCKIQASARCGARPGGVRRWQI